MEGLEQVGPRLRTARHARGWTLDELAQRAQMSSSTLSRLESGKRQSSLELLLPLTRQLGIRIDDLLPDETPDPRVHSRAFRRDGVVIEPLAPGPSPVRAFKITYPVLDEFPKPRVHDGFEWLYVLSGRLRLQVGERDVVLGKGEAAEFDTQMPHAMGAVGRWPAQILSIFNEQGERIHASVEPSV